MSILVGDKTDPASVSFFHEPSLTQIRTFRCHRRSEAIALWSVPIDPIQLEVVIHTPTLFHEMVPFVARLIEDARAKTPWIDNDSSRQDGLRK
jgi:hypothetical protein